MKADGQEERHARMFAARIVAVLAGIMLPYAARVTRGEEWLMSYIELGWGGFAFIQFFNAFAWGSILLISLLYRRPAALWPPCLLAYGYLAWAHASLNLAADAQAAVALVFIPLYAIPLAAVGGLVGYGLNRRDGT